MGEVEVSKGKKKERTDKARKKTKSEERENLSGCWNKVWKRKLK